ncbi:MAG TPA: type III-B CRISPR-associated protein Cas10/Cmr2, partial [Bacteroidetes bacterium]|nr:type III-B CRISPR-associated protein Cas10/Cmr2 [Bacteroidota bacterium]
MKKYLFSLTIGPVQSFIAQARKTQDLAAGSKMLSALARWAFELLGKELGEDKVQTIFPKFFAEDGSKPVDSNPNRFLAVIEADFSREKILEAGKNVEKKLKEKFVEDSLGRLPKRVKDKQLEYARKQLEAHLQVYWAALPLESEGYPGAYAKLEALVSGMKNYRPFKQLMERGRKCSVDGQLNVVVYRKKLGERGNRFEKATFAPDIIEVSDDSVVKIWTLQPGEGLSALSYAKRTFRKAGDVNADVLPFEPHEFPSTARLCLLHDLHLAKEGLKEKWKGIEKELVKPAGYKHSDDQLLYAENITAGNFRKTGYFEQKEESGKAAEKAAKAALKNHQEQVRKLKAVGIKNPFTRKYYAVMIFDGDDMGKWLRGEFLTDHNDLQQFHEKMAELLWEFGAWVKGYLKEEKGEVVYAGGDDFLGFISLPSLFEVLKKIRKKFDCLVNQPLQEETEKFQLRLMDETGKKQDFTFSAGIALAHYKQPLGIVLEEARKAEKEAKLAGKNSFAISQIRHSGGTTRTEQSFGRYLVQQLDAMESIRSGLDNGQYSNKFIHIIAQDMRTWGAGMSAEILETEVFRLL